ncbi:hypothetical protein PMI21_04664 [Pseudomonas sp. GM18]|uniref:hypothetical protein n=1 Tax=Pseudomonas sp. GM18 TaxID=1144324 RepID=UPI00027276F3|nr:hypothetical protein [Pseudomonas sp. GM18]EJM12617.1 hypothetical protein PMI21_04664 [Pseudomonas sp. GM18]
MAKPPKKVSSPNTPGPSSTPPRPIPGDDVVGVNPSGRPAVAVPGGESTTDIHASNALPGTPDQQPVVVTNMPVRTSGPFVQSENMVSWPRERVDQLIRIGDTGLFMSKENTLYADIERAGIGRVEPNVNGDYRVHFPFAPEHPGPVLRKVEGRPLWRVLPSTPDPRAGVSNVTAPAIVAPVHIIKNPVVIRKLPAANEHGIRWYNLRSYVDLLDEGSVQVARNANGDYQATFGQEWAPSGPVLERIELTQFWRRKLQTVAVTESNNPLPAHQQSSAVEEAGPGPSKRQRLEENEEQTGASASTEQIISLYPTHPANENPYLWVSWGKVNKPLANQSIQIGELHYQTVPDGKELKTFSNYLQHPEFPPSRFDIFEQMLQTKPWLQPVPAAMTLDGKWLVNSSRRLFEKPMTQSVADVFPDFSPVTSRAVAKRLFEYSGDSEVIARDGLYTTTLTLNHWKERAGIFDARLENPIDLLPVASRIDHEGIVISMEAPTFGEPLRRLDFLPGHFQMEWDSFVANRTDHNLKRLVSTALIRSGYEVFPLLHEHRSPKLVFKRADHDKVYFLKLGIAERNAIRTNPSPPPELSDPSLVPQVGNTALQALVTANQQNNVVWLLGGVQTAPSGWQSVFIIRER